MEKISKVLERMNKEIGTIVIKHTDDLQLKDLGEVEIRGRKAPLHVFAM